MKSEHGIMCCYWCSSKCLQVLSSFNAHENLVANYKIILMAECFSKVAQKIPLHVYFILLLFFLVMMLSWQHWVLLLLCVGEGVRCDI